MKRVYELRGHHVNSFAMELDVDRMPDFKAAEGKSKWHYVNSVLQRRYGEKSSDTAAEIWDAIDREDPDVTIKIVRGLDSICNGCELYTRICDPSGNKNSDDERALSYYGLEVEKTYSTKELKKIVQEKGLLGSNKPIPQKKVEVTTA